MKSKTRKEEEEGNLFASSRGKSLEGKAMGGVQKNLSPRITQTCLNYGVILG
jgi:hypothetical protein